MSPKKYVEHMADTSEHMFGEKPRQTVMSPLEKGDHLEIDTSDLLDLDGIQKYQSLVGAILI